MAASNRRATFSVLDLVWCPETENRTWLARRDGTHYFTGNSTELRQLKKQLGLDKATRDKEKGDDSIPNYLQNLLIRAREFGVMREKQLDKALELFQQLRALVTLYQNCDEVERRELNVTVDDLMEWMTTIAFPEFEAVDAYFREHQQRLWIRKQ
jgi:hypothetical protein